jgi:hypothetical protein
MALKPVVDSLDGVPEALRGEYTEKEGKFYLQVEDAEKVFASDVIKNRDAILTEKKKLQQQLQDIEAKYKDVNLEEIQKMKQEAEEREQQKLKSEGKIDEILNKWKAEQEKREQEWKVKLDTAYAELDTFKVDAHLRKAAEKGGIIPDLIDDVVELIKKRTQKTDKGDLLILDQQGIPLDVSLDGFFTTVFKEQKPYYYTASGAGGSGASANQNGGARGARTVPASDQSALNSNIADIAAGKVVVNPT